MVITILTLAGCALLVYVIVSFMLFLSLTKGIMDDPHSLQSPELPDVKAMTQEGWELVYSAEDKDYSLLGQVFLMNNSSQYRVIVSNTDSRGAEQDIECHSFEEAKHIADCWVNSYREDD